MAGDVLWAVGDAVEAGDVDTLTREARRFKRHASTLGVIGVVTRLGKPDSLLPPLDRSAAKDLLTRTRDEWSA